MSYDYDPTEYPLPHWAIGFAYGVYMQVGAALPTKDGRRTGNAVIKSVALIEASMLDMSIDYLLATVVTDIGNELKLIQHELEEMFYAPIYIMDLEERFNVKH